MLGSMLAGTNESPGDIFEENGKNIKSIVEWPVKKPKWIGKVVIPVLKV